jgi:hypothetical protein
MGQSVASHLQHISLCAVVRDKQFKPSPANKERIRSESDDEYKTGSNKNTAKKATTTQAQRHSNPLDGIDPRIEGNHKSMVQAQAGDWTAGRST